ncbi:acyl-CoA dehydrogenase [Mycobacterium sherrisii]|uniref:acyl-CoA dehydrogenase n=1 Tax=Mycobacterium sherrisii TaxID=243061 RepID=UPI003976A841
MSSTTQRSAGAATLALTEELADLAASVAGFARRAAPIALTRGALAELAKGLTAPSWQELVAQELHRIHLPESLGGSGAGLAELAVVVEQLGRALYPGPYLPTVTASAVVCASNVNTTAVPLVQRFSRGALGALVTGAGLSAARRGCDWCLTGTSAPTIGLPGAEIILAYVPVPGAGEHLLVVIDPDDTGVTIDAVDNTDLTRSAGRLNLNDHLVTADRMLADPGPAVVELFCVALLCAEAAGVAQACLDIAVDHIRQREQFGRVIGSFQAVQHKAAMMLVHTELVRAAAWDAARAQDDSAEQQQLAAAAAAITAATLTREVAVDAVLLLGGIGFTWEHDAHLYWRKAISLAGQIGPPDRWAQRLGGLSRCTARDYSVVERDALPELRDQVRPVLTAAKHLIEENTPAAHSGARRLLADAGLVAPHYPRPYGLAAGPREQAVIAQEFADRGLVQPTTVIGEWVLPTLLLHGSARQKDRFITDTLRGEIIWCQLFSEPGAGSDLAGLSTSATKVDGGWVITGQKVWTSKAHLAQWGVCLARTDSTVPKHQGISYFLIDMTSPGVDVRPLRQATGAAEFNEVFLTDVFVPDDCLLGAPGEGWRLATTTLTNERLSMGASFGHGSAQLIVTALQNGQLAVGVDQALRTLGECTAREMALSAMNLRNVAARISGLDTGAMSSVQKVYNAIAQRLGSTAVLDVIGPLACQSATEPDYVNDHLGLPAVLTGGGTIEIQLNVIAKRLLGLPR